jgi:signal transduction histidine kinase/Tfp pilus assembly protein PilF
MKSIAELQKELKLGKLSEAERAEAHFILAALYLNQDKHKSIYQAEQFLEICSHTEKYLEQVKLIKQIIKIAENYRLSDCLVKLYCDLGDLYRRNKLETALYFYNQALDFSIELKKSNLMAESYNNIAYIYNKQGKYDQSKVIIKKALELAKQAENFKTIVKSYNLMGEIHYYQGAFEQTLEYYLKALKMAEKTGDARIISGSFNNIGTVYYQTHDFEKAEEFFSKSLEIKLTLDDQVGLAFSYNNLGAVNFILRNYQRSLQHYQKSLAIREKINDVRGTIACCSNIGGVYFEQKKTSQAFQWFYKAYELSLQMNYKHNAALVMGNIANTHIQLGEYKEAVKSAEIELELAEELQELPLQNSAYRTMFNAYEELADYQNAYHYHKKFKEIADEIYNKDSKKIIAELKTKYELEQKEKISEILRQKNSQLVEANKLIQKKHKELEAYKDDLLLTNKILRHDVANDCSVMRSAINIYHRSPDEAMLQEIENRLNKIIATIKNQRDLVGKKAKTHKLKELDLAAICSKLAAEHQQVKIKVKGKAKVLADEKIYSVLENLLNNSLLHGKASRIMIEICAKTEFIEIRFADNGQGIPDIIKSKVFMEGFFYGESGHTGIGLHIVRYTIERYGGTIAVEDNQPQGAVFVLKLRKAT